MKDLRKEMDRISSTEVTYLFTFCVTTSVMVKLTNESHKVILPALWDIAAKVKEGL